MGGSEKVSSANSVFFGNSGVSSEGYSVQSHFRPVSIISIDGSDHAPREDDTMILVSVELLYLEPGLISSIDAWLWASLSHFYGLVDATVPMCTRREEW